MISTYLILRIISQIEDNGWWNTPTGKTVGLWLSVFIALAAVAGGVKGILYLIERMRAAGSQITIWWDEKQRVRKELSRLTQPGIWPREAKSLPDAVNNVSNRVDALDTKMDTLAGEVHYIKDIVVQEVERRNGNG